MTEPAPPPAGSAPDPARPWSFVDVVTAVLAGLGASVAAAVAVTAGGSDGLTNFEAFAIVGPAQHLATLGVLALLAPRRDPVGPALGLRVAWKDLAYLPAGMGMAIGLGIFLYLIVETFLGGEGPTQAVVEAADRATGVPTIIGVLVTAVLLAPVAEEIVFRGILFRALLRRSGRHAAVFGSAGVFAALHVVLDPSAWLASIALFLLGVMLALLVRHTGRLGTPIMLHAGFNLYSVIVLLAFTD